MLRACACLKGNHVHPYKGSSVTQKEIDMKKYFILAVLVLFFLSPIFSQWSAPAPVHELRLLYFSVNGSNITHEYSGRVSHWVNQQTFYNLYARDGSTEQFMLTPFGSYYNFRVTNQSTGWEEFGTATRIRFQFFTEWSFIFRSGGRAILHVSN
jgi:hypothetical protein